MENRLSHILTGVRPTDAPCYRWTKFGKLGNTFLKVKNIYTYVYILKKFEEAFLIFLNNTKKQRRNHAENICIYYV